MSNRPFHGFLFQLLIWKSVGTTGNRALKLANMPSLKVIRLINERIKINSQSCEKFQTFGKISRLWKSYIFVSFQQSTFKLGSFTNLRALFQGKSTDCPLLFHVKSWKKKPWKGIFSPIIMTFLKAFSSSRVVLHSVFVDHFALWVGRKFNNVVIWLMY